MNLISLMVAAVIVAAGVGSAGYFVGDGIAERTPGARVISVKDLSEGERVKGVSQTFLTEWRRLMAGNLDRCPRVLDLSTLFALATGVVFSIAFLSLAVQVRGLFGA